MSKTAEAAEDFKPGDPGVCGFCGTGDGRLGDQGDESSQLLHSSVRVGEPGAYKYERHPGALKGDWYTGQEILWCGHCIAGLIHMFQRYSDHNLSAKRIAYSTWARLDGPQWERWDMTAEEKEATAEFADDPAIHMEKLHVERLLRQLDDEYYRRHGWDMTQRGYRD